MSGFDYESLIVDIPDYPVPGVIFKDVTPLIADGEGFQAVINDIADHFADKGITKVMGAEARGFLIGAPVAAKLGVGFVPARKPGKLPRAVFKRDYALEYGVDTLEIHKDALKEGDRCILVDDLIATGGTALACAHLIEDSGAEFCGFAFLLELAFLKPREIIGKEFDQEIYSLVTVE